MGVRPWHLACLAACLAETAIARSLRVDPVQVVISEDRQSASVTLTNESDEPITVHAYPLAWIQSHGSDAYSETSAVIVSPPIATIAPSASQIVRLGFREPANAKGAWRLILEEVPSLRASGAGVRVALRMNLPLFARLERGHHSDLTWSAWRSKAGIWILQATNPTDKYIGLNPSDFSEDTGMQHDPSIRMSVVLPHSYVRWELAPNPTILDRAQFNQIARTEGSDDLFAAISTRD